MGNKVKRGNGTTYGDYVVFQEKPDTNVLKQMISRLIEVIPEDQEIDPNSIRFVFHEPHETSNPYDYYEDEKTGEHIPNWTLAILYEVEEQCVR